MGEHRGVLRGGRGVWNGIRKGQRFRVKGGHVETRFGTQAHSIEDVRAASRLGLESAELWLDSEDFRTANAQRALADLAEKHGLLYTAHAPEENWEAPRELEETIPEAIGLAAADNLDGLKCINGGGGGELVPPPQPPSSPHHKCYDILPFDPTPPDVTVTLETQFGVETGIDIQEARYLCPPAIKTIG